MARKKKAKQKTEVFHTGFVPHKFQYEFLCEWQRRNVCVCHRRFGKTDMGIMKMVDEAVNCQMPAPNYAYIAPIQKQAKRNVWRKFRVYLAPFIKAGHCRMRESALEIYFPFNDATISIGGADSGNEEAYRGNEYHGVILDEYGDMKPHVWEEIIGPALESLDGWSLFIGTPKGRNNFYEVYKDGLERPGWQAKKYPLSLTSEVLFATGSPYFNWCSKKRIAELKWERRERMHVFNREYECDFDADVEDILIPQSMLLAAKDKYLQRGSWDHEARIMGVDVAFSETGDRSSIAKRQGFFLHEPQSFQGKDNMELAAIVAREATQWQPDAIFIDKGRGEGVWSRLKQLNIKATMIDFGGTPSEPQRFKNKRAEMWWSIREWLEEGGVIPPCESLIDDLSLPQYLDEYGKIALETKKNMKKRSGRSPDEGDAVALTFALPVFPSAMRQHGANCKVVNTVTTKYKLWK